MLLLLFIPSGEPPPPPPTPANTARGGLVVNVGALLTR